MLQSSSDIAAEILGQGQFFLVTENAPHFTDAQGPLQVLGHGIGLYGSVQFFRDVLVRRRMPVRDKRFILITLHKYLLLDVYDPRILRQREHAVVRLAVEIGGHVGQGGDAVHTCADQQFLQPRVALQHACGMQIAVVG